MNHIRIVGWWVGFVLAVAAAARPFTVVAYNVENLFDVDGVAGYEDTSRRNTRRRMRSPSCETPRR